MTSQEKLSQEYMNSSHQYCRNKTMTQSFLSYPTIIVVGTILALATFARSFDIGVESKEKFDFISIEAEEGIRTLSENTNGYYGTNAFNSINEMNGLLGSGLLFALDSNDRLPDTTSCAFPFCAYPNILYKQNDTLTKERYVPCSEKDIGSFFTPCDNQNKKHLIQYYKAPAMCDVSSGTVLNAPIEVDCSFKSCSAGSFFDAKKKECIKCPKGEFSVGDVLYFANATSWPAETFIREFNVNGSVRTGTIDDVVSNTQNILSIIHNEVINPNSTSFSELTFRVFVSSPPATLAFDYRVFGGETERQIGGSFYRWLVRNTGEIVVRVMDQNSGGKMVFHENSYENSNDWKSKRVELKDRGTYDIMLRFNRQFSRSDSMNGMQVKDLRIEGMSEKITACLKCPPGTFASEEGSGTCSICPKNTFSAKEGSTACESCPPGQTSYEGSSECRAGEIPCTEKDYYSVETENNCFDEDGNWNPNGMRKFKYLWMQPQICQENATSSVTLPPIEEKHCPSKMIQCSNPGQVVHKSREEIHCGHCMELRVPDENHSTCVECPADSFPVNKTLIITNFDKHIDLLQNFSTSCLPESQCQSNGFRRSTTFMDSGVGNGRSISQFSFNVDAIHHFTGSILINYTMVCTPGKARASFFVDDSLHHLAECTGCDATEESSLLIAIRPAHVSKIRVEYNSLDTMYHNSCGFLKVNSISMNSLGVGGYSACESCSAGLELQEVDGNKVCVKCDPGHYSEKGGRCTKCPKGTYAPDFGTETCLQCPDIMTSKEGALYCEFPSNPTEVNIGIATDGSATRYNWTNVVTNNINSKRIAIPDSTAEKKIIINLPDIKKSSDDDPRSLCPPHSLACIEMKVNGYMEIFSLADVAEITEATDPVTTRDYKKPVSFRSLIQPLIGNAKLELNDEGLDVSGAPSHMDSEEEDEQHHQQLEDEIPRKTIRLYKENNRFCGGQRSQVDVNFKCTHHDIPIVTANQISNCTFVVEVQSIESCRLCYDSEYTLVKRTECIGNKLEKHWVVKENAPLCNSKSAPPPNTWEFCVKENLLYLAWLIPSLALLLICCITGCCCIGSVALLKKVRTLKDENERLSLLHHEGVELGERRDVGLDATDP